MSKNEQQLLEIINQVFESEWELYYDDEKVRLTHQKLSALVEEYYTLHLNGSKEAETHLTMIQEFRTELENAINEAKEIRQVLATSEATKLSISALRSLAREASQKSRNTKFEAIHNAHQTKKVTKLAKIGLVASVALFALCGGVQGYLFMETQTQTEEIVNAKLSGEYQEVLKNAVLGSLQEQVKELENPELIKLKEKSSELETKVGMFEADSVKVMELDAKVARLQETIAQLSTLKTKISKLEQTSKPAAKVSKVTKPSRSVASVKAKKAPKASKSSAKKRKK